MRIRHIIGRLGAALLPPLLVLAAPLSGPQVFRCAMDRALHAKCCCHPGDRLPGGPRIQGYCCDVESVAAFPSVDRERVRTPHLSLPIQANLTALHVGLEPRHRRALAHEVHAADLSRGPPIILLKRSLLI